MCDVLKKFNFGNDFLNWINILYNRPTFSVKNNGWLTKKQEMSRGIRQGCPLSCLLFIIVVEILGTQLRKCEDVKGFTFGNKEYKVSQYTDDAITILSTLESITCTLDIINSFSRVAGPHLNMEKVEGIWLGPMKDRMPSRFAGINWTSDPVRCLGIYFGHNKTKCDELNWNKKMNDIKRIIMHCNRRNLSLIGKTVIVKALIIPKVIFVAALVRPPEAFVKILNKELKNLLGLKTQRLKYNCIIGKIEDGGLGFPDIECIFNSQKATWITRLLKGCHCKNIANYWYNKIGLKLETVIKCNFRSSKVFPVIKTLPHFYQDIIIAYNRCKTNKSIISCTPHEIVSELIWGNERYMLNGKCLYSKNWIQSDIMYVKDIMNDEGKIICGNVLLGKLKAKQNWIAEYLAVKNACKIIEIKDIAYLCQPGVHIKVNRQTIFVDGKHYDVCDRDCKFFYNALRNKKFKYPYMQEVWCNELKLDTLRYKYNWEKIYVNKVKKMPLTKLGEFNYKVLSGTIPCGFLLSKWKDNIDPKCTVCDELENIKHILYECNMVKDVWKYVGIYFNINLMWKHIVVGYFTVINEMTKTINLIISFIAYSIFKANNRSKWNEQNYNTVNVKESVIHDLRKYVKIQEYCLRTVFNTKILEDILKYLENKCK